MMLAELKNVTKSYLLDKIPGKGKQDVPYMRVLDGISLSIAERNTMAIVGPSGSGKSTLLNLIGCLDKPDTGEVYVNGTNTRDLSDDMLSEIRNRHIGFVFQMHHLLPQLSIIDNVMLPVLPQANKQATREAHDHAMFLLEKVGIGDHYKKHPYRLSVGECQRAAVVRALINRPRLVLADEPTGSLDAANAAALGELLISLAHAESAALVVVTHSIDLAARMGHTFRLGSGKLSPLP